MFDRLLGGSDLIKAMGESIAEMQMLRSREQIGLAPRRRQWRGSAWYAPNGKRECARRRRQIERGQLRAENGLVECKTFVVAE